MLHAVIFGIFSKLITVRKNYSIVDLYPLGRARISSGRFLDKIETVFSRFFKFKIKTETINLVLV